MYRSRQLLFAACAAFAFVACQPARADAPTKPREAPPDPTAEAQRINARVSAWRYKLATFQFDQMTRRMNDLLKPAG